MPTPSRDVAFGGMRKTSGRSTRLAGVGRPLGLHLGVSTTSLRVTTDSSTLLAAVADIDR